MTEPVHVGKHENQELGRMEVDGGRRSCNFQSKMQRGNGIDNEGTRTGVDAQSSSETILYMDRTRSEHGSAILGLRKGVRGVGKNVVLGSVVLNRSTRSIVATEHREWVAEGCRTS